MYIAIISGSGIKMKEYRKKRSRGLDAFLGHLPDRNMLGIYRTAASAAYVM